MGGVRSLVTLAATLVLAAPAAAADQPVAFGGSLGRAYDPSDVTIKAGDTATFSGDFGVHPLHWDNDVFPRTNSGPPKQFAFAQPGTYTYYCEVHVNSDNMRGVVRVVANQHPATVSFSVSPTAPRAGEPVTFTYTGSADPDGSLVSWQWDLDGDGSFETSTPGGAVSKTYANAGAVTVRMRAIDDSGEPSDVAAQAVTIAAAGSGDGGSGSSGSSGATDTTAPRATLIRLRGLKLSFRSSERASATATLRARGKTIARGTAKAKDGAIAIRLRLTKAGRSLLPRGRTLRAKLTLTLRDASGNRTTVRRQLKVKR
jgi:plastocyanin